MNYETQSSINLMLNDEKKVLFQWTVLCQEGN